MFARTLVIFEVLSKLIHVKLQNVLLRSCFIDQHRTILVQCLFLCSILVRCVLFLINMFCSLEVCVWQRVPTVVSAS